MEQSEVQEKCREFAELQKIKQQVTQRHAELQQEIFYLADREEAEEIIFVDNDGVVQTAAIKLQAKYDVTELSKVYELLPEGQVDAGRQLIRKEEVVTQKVDGLRAKQLEKLGGNVAAAVRKARDIASRKYISIKESK
jgi:hypothetical protein|tara:strand:+ start:1567 stop:1980 length:414 start_codon:yes stop_codon:yes gene_type:complete